MYYRISKNEKILFFGKKIAQVWAVTLNWASIATRESLTFVHANNKGAGLSSYPRSLISAFIVRLLESIISELNCLLQNFMVRLVWDLLSQKPARQLSRGMAFKMYLTTYFNQKDPV